MAYIASLASAQASTGVGLQGQRLLQRVRGEFTEMPGLKLTRVQLRRLFALTDAECEQVIDALIEERYIRRFPDGQYMRRTAAP